MQNVNHKERSNKTNDHQTGDAGHGNKIASLNKTFDLNPGDPVPDDLFLDLNQSDDDEASEVESFVIDQDELDEDDDSSRFLLSTENLEDDDGEIRTVDPETHARLEALLEAAGLGKLSTADGKAFADPEVLRRLTSSVSCALDEAAAALTRMRAEQQAEGAVAPIDSTKTLAQACSSGDIGAVKQLLDEGRSVHETTEEGESLLSLACSAGYYELAQVLLAMRANVEDRGIKGDCTPLMEAASGGYVEIVKLLISHGADVNAQSSAGNTPLHYAACGGHQQVVRVLIDANANVEEHNENGHTPLMEAASAGHVGVAKLLLQSGAGINTHSNEFKESALTLACYKGHLEMVKFLLEAGADHEHKTDEMHTALMEACMDGHVEVARLLLDSGAQVNMPIDSFESPLTLAACGGHVELANLLIERGANLEEVNDEGYTPLMEASREGHEEMVALLLAHGADINGQTEETQETALTLACCGGFQEVADFLIKAGADMELGCSTPLMEAAQEGHLELVKYLIKANANVHQQTQTGDTALTYACENGHTDVAEVLLEAHAELEHQSEGGRTPLMKAARAGHLCTVQFLIGRGADVNRTTSTNDHTVLSLACAGGHLPVVELMLRHGADSAHKLKDGSTMLIEAAKGGHTTVVNLLLDWPTSMLSPTELNPTTLSPPQTTLDVNQLPRVPIHGLPNFVPPQDPNKTSGGQAAMAQQQAAMAQQQAHTLVQQVQASVHYTQPDGTPAASGEINLGDLNIPRHSFEQIKENMKASLSACKKRISTNSGGVVVKEANAETKGGRNGKAVLGDTGQSEGSSGGAGGGGASFAVADTNWSNNASSHSNIQVVSSQVSDIDSDLSADFTELSFADGGSPISLDLESRHDMKASERLEAFINKMMQKAELLNTTREEQILKKQQILEELQKVEQELQEKAKLHMILNAQQKLETEKLRLKQLELQDIERRMLECGITPPGSEDQGAAGIPGEHQRAHLHHAQKSSTDSESAFDSVEVPKPPSEVSSLDRDGENLDEDIVYVYEGDSDNYDEEDDDDDDRVTDGDDEMIDSGECFLAEGLTEEQVRECEERLNQAVRLEMEKLDERFSEKLKLNAAQLTCAPNPVPLHIALTNDLQNQLQLGLSSIAASLPSRSSEITKMANLADAVSVPMTSALTNGPLNGQEEDEEPKPSEDVGTLSAQSQDEKQSRPKLAKQESLSSVNSDTEEAQGSADASRLGGALPSRDTLNLPDGSSVDPAPLSYFTPPTGSPERASSSDPCQVAPRSPQSSRASSEEVDLSNVMPAMEAQLMDEADAQKMTDRLTPQQLQLLQQQLQQHQLLQQRLAIAKDRRLAAAVSAVVTPAYSGALAGGNIANNAVTTSVIVANPQQLAQAAAAGGAMPKLMIPVQLEPLTAQAITPANAAAIQKQLEQQRQQLQAQLVLQQQLQHELQQQLKLQQEHEQLKQQLEAHQAQVAAQQKQLQAQTNKMKGNQVKIQQASLNISTTTTTLESLQQEINQQELQHLKLQQVQQHLQQLHQQLQQVQQLQNNHQLTQQELLQQAQHLHQQLQAAQLQQLVQGQPLHTQVAATGIVTQPMQVNQQMAHLLSQPDLLQQAQHLQQLAQVQRQQNALQQQQPSLATPQTLPTGPRTLVAANTAISTAISAVTTVPVVSGPAAVVGAGGNCTTVNNLNATAVKKVKKKHNLFNQQQQQQLQAPQSLDAQQLQQHQLQQLQVLQQQQLQQQFQQQQQLYQLQQQQYQQQLGQQQAQMLNNPTLAQQIVDYSQTVANNTGIPHQQLCSYYLDLVNQSPTATPVTPNPSPASPQVSPPVYPSVELDAQTESNHDTALTLACAGGHAELVSLLLSRGAEIEHRDKKGFTPLILASTAGHTDIVEILLDHGADIEAQSERTKDTPLSLACSGGRYEVVELLLQRGANKEHRNVSDYTPLSLAASGGYVNIIKLLLSYNAEINSRTGSKLGISPLMLAAMNGHTAAVKLLLDMGSDINAQIETNRNTALTLACFQGRHEVVSLLVDRKANIEHRAKTGLTPLMEAASGGYVEVGRVLLDKGADVNASPVPSSKDTALTIAADKGHFRFVELLINKHAAIDVRNKKGNSPLWLACNGGHLDVAQLLVNAKADVDSQDNRKVSCLMAAFRKGHIKCVKWMVKHVTQFPSDQECMRFIQTVTDKELLKKCHQCMEIIVSAKDRQAAEANKNANILLEEIESERSREETKRERAARKREKRRQKKKEKQEKERTDKEKEREDIEPEEELPIEEPLLIPEPEPVAIAKATLTTEAKKNSKNRSESPQLTEDDLPDICKTVLSPLSPVEAVTGDKQTNGASTNNKNKKKKKGSKTQQQTNSMEDTSSTKDPLIDGSSTSHSSEKQSNVKSNKLVSAAPESKTSSKISTISHIETKSKSSSTPVATSGKVTTSPPAVSSQLKSSATLSSVAEKKVVERNNTKNSAHSTTNKSNKKVISAISSTTGIGDLDDFGALPSQMSDLKLTTPNKKDTSSSNDKKNTKAQNKKMNLDSLDMPLISPLKSGLKTANTPSPKKGGSKREQEGWKEVIRRSKKIVVPSNAVNRVIGRHNVNVNAIKEVSGANIDIDNTKSRSGDRTLIIKGQADATKRAYDLLSALIKDPDKDVDQLIPKLKSNKVVNTNTLTMSSNVWHNSMANNISTASQNTTQNQSQPANKPPTTVARLSSSTTVSITTTASRPAANGGKSTMSHIGTFQVTNGTAIWGNPGQPPAASQARQSATIGMFTSATSTVNYTPEKSPSIVSRQLFPKDGGKESSQQTSSANLQATYSSPSMAKTKLVDTTTPAFSIKENNSKSAVGNNRPQRAQVAPIARPVPASCAQSGSRPEPQPLPIKAPIGQNPAMSRTAPIPNTSASAVGDFSPFNNNLISQVTQGILGGKKDDDVRMNFASVAAQGVVPNSSSYSESVTSSLNTSAAELDPSKIVGYKGPGQRTASPHVTVDADLANRAPGAGYRGPHGPSFNPGINVPPQMAPNMPPGSLEGFTGHPAFMNQPDLYRLPGGFRFGMPPNAMMPPLPQSAGLPEFSKAPGHNKPSSGPPSQNMSPRSSSSTPVSMNDQSPRSSLRGAPLLLRNDDEYSSPNTPMTLPKIESNLNPDAPHFMSRHPHSGLGTPPLHMTHPPPIGPGMQPPIHPAFRPSYPTGPLGGPAPGAADFNMNELQNSALALLAQGGGMNLMGSLMARPGSPLMQRGAHTGMQTQPPSNKEDGLSGEGTASHDLPRPIGTERGQKRAHTPGTVSGGYQPPHADHLDELGAGPPGGAGLWAYSDVPSDWLAAMTSMITTTVMTNTMATSSMSVPGASEQRPHSQPSFTSSAGPPSFGLPDNAAAHMLQHLEQGIQPPQRSMFTAPSQSTAYANGIGAGLGGLPQGPSGGDGLSTATANLWAHPPNKLDGSSAGDTVLSNVDPKLAWTNWSQPPSNA